MELCASCIRCLMDRQEERVRQKGTEADRSEFLRNVARIIAESAETDSAPVLVDRVNQVYRRIFGAMTDYSEIKKDFNALMLSVEPQIREVMEKSEDPLRTAMLYARAANYIDFGMAGAVEKEVLFELLNQAAQDEMDEKVYGAFLKDLAGAQSLVYVTDNCGEVVCDRIVVQELAARFPHLAVTVMVRGEDALNDATMEDADQVGLTQAAKVVGNGCSVAGTPLEYVGEEAGQVLRAADVILAKGQGNFETMHGCGLNVYYSFLCKCDWFQTHFGMEKNKGMFIRE